MVKDVKSGINGGMVTGLGSWTNSDTWTGFLIDKGIYTGAGLSVVGLSVEETWTGLCVETGLSVEETLTGLCVETGLCIETGLSVEETWTGLFSSNAVNGNGEGWVLYTDFIINRHSLARSS